MMSKAFYFALISVTNFNFAENSEEPAQVNYFNFNSEFVLAFTGNFFTAFAEETVNSN